MTEIAVALALRSALSRLLLHETQALIKDGQIVLTVPYLGRVVVKLERDGG
jgi:hypothetical protein